MNSENKEQTPKKTAQFVCDYRDEQPTEFLPQLQMHSAEETKEEPSSEPIDNTIPTIHVTLDDSNMIETEQEGNETPEYPTMPEQEEPSPEIEGFPLWKRNNQPSRLFYPANPQIAQQQEEEIYEDETKQSKPKGIIPGGMFLYVWRSRLGTKYRANQCFFSACYDAKSGTVFIVVTGKRRYDFASFRMEGGDTKSGKL